MFRRLLTSGTIMMAVTSSVHASDTILTPPMRIDGLAIELTTAVKAGQVALPSIELSTCEEPFWYKCHYQLGHSGKITVSGPKRDEPATAIWATVSDERDLRTYLLLVDFFMARFADLGADRRANLLESAAADLEAGKTKVEIEGERATLILDHRDSGEYWITVGGR